MTSSAYANLQKIVRFCVQFCRRELLVRWDARDQQFTNDIYAATEHARQAHRRGELTDVALQAEWDRIDCYIFEDEDRRFDRRLLLQTVDELASVLRASSSNGRNES